MTEKYVIVLQMDVMEICTFVTKQINNWIIQHLILLLPPLFQNSQQAKKKTPANFCGVYW